MRRKRPGTPFWRILILLILIAGSLYLLMQLWDEESGALTTLSTPVPLPTPTRSAVSFSAEAVDFYRAGQLTDAVDAYQQALDLAPEQIDLHLSLARISIFRGRPERGLVMAREALRLEPENARAWAITGLAYDWLGLPDEAVEACDKAIELDPTLPEAYAYLAEAYIDLGNWAAANNTIDTALQLDENNADVQRNYGYILEVQGNYTSAIAAYRKALELQPGMPYLYLAIGRNQQALADIAGARESYEAAAENDPKSAAALDMLGWTYLLESDYDSAQRSLDQAVAADATYSRALGHLASLYFQRRNYEDAIPAFEQAVRYGEAEIRQKATFFRVTLETAGQIPEEPGETEVGVATFVAPIDSKGPLRAVFADDGEGTSLRGYVRMDVLDGRYQINLQGLAAPPSGQAYVGWFEPLRTAEGVPIHTEGMTPDAQGTVTLNSITGPVKGPPIEHYYTLALCYYFLEQCSDAQPYIDVALRIDPDDANALQMMQLCGE